MPKAEGGKQAVSLAQMLQLRCNSPTHPSPVNGGGELN
ncbi:hypothetical protein HPS12939_0289 [Glaesserella parasuis 12939]|nr:hypothetical protein HPSMNH_0401 [Glaesserella parasuis MN-H]EQA03302.1 hypothetical protein HPSSW114_0487 [Glaesserella parasuis SW114]EQA06262.1 hypothetical protein HPS12939_0289 [Glaesserella parasuis 12939]EQA10441.1 hypothetical protein HPSD74_0791 [Glaesserella parasuis D74]EQA14451.1 hypothetical protein HPS174_0508 [Glaesserella parasuis 174]